MRRKKRGNHLYSLLISDITQHFLIFSKIIRHDFALKLVLIIIKIYSKLSVTLNRY